MRKIFIFLLCLILATLVASYSFALTSLKTGEPAPVFKVQDVNGKEISLTDYRGKIVVLEWFNSECPFVKKHYNSNNMQNTQKESTESGIVWITVNSSAKGKQGYMTPEEAKVQLKSVGMLSTALVLDPEGSLGKLYGAKTTPHMFVIDGDGNLAYQGAIDDNESTNINSIVGAKNYVASAIKELLVGKSVGRKETQPYGCSVKYQ